MVKAIITFEAKDPAGLQQAFLEAQPQAVAGLPPLSRWSIIQRWPMRLKESSAVLGCPDFAGWISW